MKNINIVHTELPPAEYYSIRERIKNSPKTYYWFWDEANKSFQPCYIEEMHYATNWVSVVTDKTNKYGGHKRQMKLNQLFASLEEAETKRSELREACLKNYKSMMTDVPSVLMFVANHDINPNENGVENLARTAFLDRCKELFNLDLTPVRS